MKVNYDKRLGETPDIWFFRTRRDAFNHAWFVMNRPDVNLFKEGPKYVLQIGSVTYATPWRSLWHFSVADFEKCIRTEYVPF